MSELTKTLLNIRSLRAFSRELTRLCCVIRTENQVVRN